MINKIKKALYNFIIKYQKKTGTDNVYIAKYGSLLIIGNFISIVAGFLLSIAFANLLPKEIYGQYKYILSIVSILAIFSLQGLNNAVIQGVAQGYEGIIKKSLKTKVKWSLMGSLAAIIIAIYFWFQNNIDFTISFLIVAFFLPVFKGYELYQSFLDGKKLFGKRITYSTLTQVLSSIFTIVALFFTQSIIILILTYFLSYSVFRFLFFWVVIKKTKPNKKENDKIISYGKHLSLIKILAIISQQIDSILLFNFLGPVQLAIYSFAVTPVGYIRTPFQIIQELALPKLANRTEKEIKKTLPKKLIKAVVLILIIIAAYSVFAPYIYKLIYPQYLEAINYSRLFSITLLVFPVSMIVLSLQAKMKTKELYKVNIVQIITQILFIAILTPLYGIAGIILARIISQIIYFIVSWFLFKKM